MLLNAGIRWFHRYGPTLPAFLLFIYRLAAPRFSTTAFVAFADRARKQGTDVVLETWEDMNHDFQMFGLESPQSAEALRRIGQVIEEKVCVRKEVLTA